MLIFIGLVGYLLYFLQKTPSATPSASANVNAAVVSSKAEWDGGTATNLDSDASPGSIKILNKSETNLDLGALFGAGSISITTNANDGTKGNAIDADNFTSWDTGFSESPVAYTWTINMGSSYYFKTLSMFTDSACPFYASYSNDGSSYTEASFGSCSGPNPPGAGVRCSNTINGDGQYFRLTHTTSGACPAGSIYDVDLSATGMSTHKATVDGGVNFWEWESFSDTKTVPANTAVNYRYRTSADGVSWTSWVSSIASVTSRVGNTKYRYLQIEATLTNTDGASTPSVDSYSVQYHTDVKPNKPTAATAVVQ